MKAIPISIHRKHIPALSGEYSFERRARHAAVCALALSLCLYGYFVTASVFHVMGREEALLESKRLSAATASLEREFFAKTELLTPERGNDLGLVPVAAAAYVQGRSPVVDATPLTSERP